MLVTWRLQLRISCGTINERFLSITNHVKFKYENKIERAAKIHVFVSVDIFGDIHTRVVRIFQKQFTSNSGYPRNFKQYTRNTRPAYRFVSKKAKMRRHFHCLSFEKLWLIILYYYVDSIKYFVHALYKVNPFKLMTNVLCKNVIYNSILHEDKTFAPRVNLWSDIKNLASQGNT